MPIVSKRRVCSATITFEPTLSVASAIPTLGASAARAAASRSRSGRAAAPSATRGRSRSSSARRRSRPRPGRPVGCRLRLLRTRRLMRGCLLENAITSSILARRLARRRRICERCPARHPVGGERQQRAVALDQLDQPRRAERRGKRRDDARRRTAPRDPSGSPRCHRRRHLGRSRRRSPAAPRAVTAARHRPA